MANRIGRFALKYPTNYLENPSLFIVAKYLRAVGRGKQRKQTTKGGRAGGSLPMSCPLSGPGCKGTKSCGPRNLRAIFTVTRAQVLLPNKSVGPPFLLLIASVRSMNPTPGDDSPKHFWQFPLGAGAG